MLRTEDRKAHSAAWSGVRVGARRRRSLARAGGARAPDGGAEARRQREGRRRRMFISTCSACHTLKAAGALGQIGPNLDKNPLTEATIIKAITNGGATVMTKAQLAKYTTQMTAVQGSPQRDGDQQHRRVRLHLDARSR